MKTKIIAVVLITAFTFSLTACKNEKDITNNSSTVSTNNPSTSNCKKTYFESNPEKSDAYNAALTAYNSFLCGEVDAKEFGKDKMHSINDSMQIITGKTGVDRYGLFDINNDDVPELLTRSVIYDIYSFNNGQVLHWYSSEGNILNGDINLLENGSLFSTHDSTGIFYCYTTFNSDGTYSEVNFADPQCEDSKYPYLFYGKEVSKEEYEQVTKDYFALAKKPADIEWFEY